MSEKHLNIPPPAPPPPDSPSISPPASSPPPAPPTSSPPPAPPPPAPPPAALTVLQLDTQFPRLPGDVAAPETYQHPINITRIPKASVKNVITTQPQNLNIKPFEHAAQSITSSLGVASCGFLAYWQNHLDSLCPKPFVASALIDLPLWCQAYKPQEIAILTFDADTLTHQNHRTLLADFKGAIIGLTADMHLHQVIKNDSPRLNHRQAEAELIALLKPYFAKPTLKAPPKAPLKALVFECTNLPPYRQALKAAFNVQIFDILTAIDRRMPNLVKPEFIAP